MEIDSSSKTSAESETVSVCLKCGNGGFEETLVYCFKCQGYALHRYCLDGPVVFTDEVIWFCEDCEIQVIDVDSSDNEIVDSKNAEVSFSEDCEVDVICEDFSDDEILDSENAEVSFSEDCDQDRADSKNVEVEGCDVEVIEIDSSDNEIADSKNNEVNSVEDCDQDTADSKKVETKDCDQVPADSEKVEVEDFDVEMIDVDNSDNAIEDSENTEVSSSEDFDQDTADSDKVEVDSRYECVTVEDPHPIADSKNTEINSSEDSDQDKADSQKSEVESRYECENVADSHPIADPIWRGSLQLINKSFELMAHLSSIACPKVHEVSRHLPNVLDADLLQRSAVGPKLFMKFRADNEDIGLYFFPQNERGERYFDELVYEMIFNDLVIRAEVEVAELLIFSSTTLPSEYRRIQSKYYLWGLFRKKQTPS